MIISFPALFNTFYAYISPFLILGWLEVDTYHCFVTIISHMLLCAPEATGLKSHRETTNCKACKVSNDYRLPLFVITHLVTINPSAAEILN